MKLFLSFFLWTVLLQTSVYCQTVTIAVASSMFVSTQNFAKEFEYKHPKIRIVLLSGSTGRLYTQIIHGAPYDVFMAADSVRPKLLAQSFLKSGKVALSESRKTYAEGHLMLWSLNVTLKSLEDLRSSKIQHIVIATPKVAPYGLAAQEVLQKTKLWEVLQNKLVYAQNVLQARMMIQRGIAEVGFVAEAPVSQGNTLKINPRLHSPMIHQIIALKERPEVFLWMSELQQFFSPNSFSPNSFQMTP